MTGDGEDQGADAAEPDDWPTHRLLSIAARVDELWINRNLAQLGLTKSALDALEAVAEIEPANLSDVAALLRVSKQSTGRLISRLQSLGLLAKAPGNDRRNANIRLTEQGRSALREAEELIHAMPHGGPATEEMLRRHLQDHISALSRQETRKPHH
jgi:DNA-binding MarR family transcriptional regulator